MINPSDIIKFGLFSAAIVFFFSWFTAGGGSLIIERPYHNEYKQCQQDFKELEEAKTPQCAACECSETASGSFFWVLGLIFLVGAEVMFFYRSRKLDKREEKLREMKDNESINI